MNARRLELEVWLAYHWLLKDYSLMDGFKARDIGMRVQKKILSRMATKNVARVFIDERSANILDNLYKLVKDYYASHLLRHENFVSCIIERAIESVNRPGAPEKRVSTAEDVRANTYVELKRACQDEEERMHRCHVATGSKKEAEKLVKNLIKVVVKMAVLYRHDQLTKEDFILADKLKNRFNAAALAIISFFEVDFTYDKLYLTKHFNECQVALGAIIERHLTEKSLHRVQHVFQIIGDPDFLDAIFRSGSPHRPVLQAIVKDMSDAMDAGEL